MRKKIINFCYNNKILRLLLPLYHIIIGRTVIQRMGVKNIVESGTANLLHDTFAFGQATINNRIEIGDGTSLEYSNITIKGNNNHILIGKNGFLNGLNIVLEGDNNYVLIGDDAFVLGDTRMYVVDGSALKIGNGCMLSDRIDIRTTDNHAIIDRDSGKRINPEENVEIKDRVWIGTGVTILKGVEIAEGCIIGAGSIITRKHTEKHTVIAGNPGREIKYNIAWTMER